VTCVSTHRIVLVLSRLAENVAEAYGITRHEQDAFALQSQLKCEQAVSQGHFDAEIEPIRIRLAGGTLNVFVTCRVDITIGGICLVCVDMMSWRCQSILSSRPMNIHGKARRSKP
jgi:hypothetical protein